MYLLYEWKIDAKYGSIPNKVIHQNADVIVCAIKAHHKTSTVFLHHCGAQKM